MRIKDTYWFKHDSNAKDDFKCMLLIEQLGCAGYGIFWILVETLREQKDYKYPIYLLSALARKYNTTQAKMETVVNNYKLFEIDKENLFFSHSFNRRMENLDKIKEQRRIAGKKSGESRKNKLIEQKVNKCSSKVKRLEKNKVEKINKEIITLRSLCKMKSANELLEISKDKSYENLFSKEIIDFIVENKGLIRVKTIIEDSIYDDWIINQVLKLMEQNNDC